MGRYARKDGRIIWLHNDLDCVQGLRFLKRRLWVFPNCFRDLRSVTLRCSSQPPHDCGTRLAFYLIFKGTVMKINATRMILTALLGGLATTAQAAGTLVYCSEGSPAGFDTAQYSAGTDFDVSAETV